MKASNISKEYLEIVKKDEDRYYKDYEQTVDAVANSNAKYKGEPIPFLYQPIIFTQEDIDNFKQIGKTLISITNKVVDKYIESPKFRKKFGYSKLLEELILADHGYDINVPIGRFDIFYGGGDNFKFCELNTDGSSAMNEDNTLARIILDSKPIVEMKEKYDINYFELIYSWVEESINIYNTFDNAVDKPNVAIVDFEGSGTPAEFEEFKKAYIDKGYNAVIVDPRQLKYNNGKLYFEDMEINLVYRRIVTRELVDRSDEIQDFIQAYKDKAVCVIGPIKSQIMHNKIIFKILHDEDTLEFLNENEREYIKKHVPYTIEFENDREIFNEALENKDRYVVKPRDLYASKGVYVGRDFNEEDWKQKLEECWEHDYLLQEFCQPYKQELVQFKDSGMEVNKFNHILGLFMYNEKLKGLYTRVGSNNIVSGLHGYYTVPNLLFTEK
ncbi:MAG: hypothetical protein FH761_18615 [Firmicutes bacterium]|nr:hypothetical protein [Bacillota bacterium]